jgi:peptide/nickel transport system permease protein
MGRYIARRLLWVLVVIVLVTFFTFVIFTVMPPVDPAVLFAGRRPTPQLIAEIEESLGLDQGFWQQYGNFLHRIFLGDEFGWPGFGESFLDRAPIRDKFLSRAWITFQLAAGAAVIWLLLGIGIGIASALKRGKWQDRLSMGFALFGVSAPVFWLGLMALYIFWEKLGLPMGTGYVPFAESPAQWFLHLILPWTVLALLFAAFYARMVRGSLLDSFGQDWIRTARAKGLSERRVVFKHGLRASLTPVVSMFGADFGTLLGGAIITENVFNLQGLGFYVVQSVQNGDIPVIMDVVVFGSLAVTLMSLMADILYAFLDPRVRYS